ncbi:putative class I-like SAM-binding methyltransferase superfamily, C5-methyltransferase family protein [Lyophyllum shimeji]|uniref:DNA (cytosine-5-)-methyltransferase n=1 Tax=Lyophyllum shimeji TaxID=47721 RepID=A0A9P3USG9_LYOSH|nr:putative class I-like SAM-binding methyltransferase superfamily, C5-methyltransferase family protein [Lyophyllum shimeji]
MARRRPNAFEVSFPEEAQGASPSLLSSYPTDSSSTSRPTSLKRKGDAYGAAAEGRQAKRLQLPPPAFYEDEGYERESDSLVLNGEDPSAGEERDGKPDKPVRVLDDFTFFDPNHRNEMVSLTAIEEDDGVERQFEGAGVIYPYVVNEEDKGQEDDDTPPDMKNIRLGAILRYTFDYTQPNDPVWIETQFAWYILRTPSTAYAPYFQHFFTPRRIAQTVVSSALKHPRRTYQEFLQRLTATVDAFGRTYQEDHIWGAIPEIQEAVDDYDNSQRLKAHPILQHILRRASPSQTRPKRRNEVPHNRRPPPIKALLGNPEIAVLKRENQTATHVTPFIASLARGLVHEELIVVGGRPPPRNMAEEEAQKEATHRRICELVTKARQRRNRVEVQRTDYVGGKTSSRYLTAVAVEGERFKSGDFVLIPINFGYSRPVRRQEKEYVPPSKFPEDIRDIAPTSTIADYFWFAKILYGDIDTKMFHVRWLQHSSQTMMEELGHPQELFFNDLCDHVPFGAVISRIVVHEGPDPPPKPDEYFVKFVYDIQLATYTSINSEMRDLAAQDDPPYNCTICPRLQQQEQEQFDTPLKDEKGIVNGVAYHGHRYHYEDFVLYRADSGPAHIGYITGFDFRQMRGDQVMTQVFLRRVGRISSIADLLPDDVPKDERHVFITDELATVPLRDLIRVCYVFPEESIPNLQEWLSLSSLHFFIKPCTAEKLEELKKMEHFFADAERHPLKVLDIFGGVGAFSMGLAEGSGCLQLTDLVEISPSAAKTVERNFPDVTVHNQCANKILRYSIKQKSGQRPETPKQIYDGKTEVCSLSKPDVVAAGVPCQTHSYMNMFRKEGDIKSNLILTALSFVDHLRPKLFYFENVPGFLRFSFDAKQAGIHRLEGGVPMGGLKFVVRALVDMRYQVRFGLLQAGHYGAPQRRNRFFLIAAVDGHPLPELPEPSHDFPDNAGLEVKLPVGTEVRPFRMSNGTAPHRHVTIGDAISDLPRFDWLHPKPHVLLYEPQLDMRNRRAQGIPALPCVTSSTRCGLSGVVEYHHPPRTTYQETARRRPTEDLQHFTRTFAPPKIERVLSIPLRANADYRDLPFDKRDWSTSHPFSSAARKNFRPGLYGRLDENHIFPTIVTNMDTTAKQSRVLNPYCHRMVTVRELARAQGFPDHFVFVALDHNVVTMHRQIGNAVPLQIGTALGRELRLARFKNWMMSRQDAIVIDSDDDD